MLRVRMSQKLTVDIMEVSLPVTTSALRKLRITRDARIEWKNRDGPIKTEAYGDLGILIVTIVFAREMKNKIVKQIKPSR